MHCLQSCEFMCKKKRILGILKGNMDLQIQFLFGFYTKKHVQARTRVFHSTSRYLCEKLGPHLKKQHTLMRNSVLMEDKIIMSLIQIGNGNGLQLVNDMFEVDKSIISMIMKELYFCKITKKKKPPLFLGTFRNLCIHFSLNHNQNAHLKMFPIHTTAFCFIKLKIFLLNNHPFCSFYFTIHIGWPHLFL